MKNGKLKERVKGMAMGVLLCALVFSGVAVFANPQGAVQRTLHFNGIRVFLDGAEIVPRDGMGNLVEPFTMDGTTYLPVRSIADALGVLVYWDSTTNSVHLGRRTVGSPSNYLDRIPHSSLTVGNSDNLMHRLEGSVTDWVGNTYTNGLIFQTHLSGSSGSRINNCERGSQIIATFPIDSNYTTLTGRVSMPRNISSVGLSSSNANTGDSEVVYIHFYGGGGHIYSVRPVNRTTPQDFSINVAGLDFVQIRVEYRRSNWTRSVALTDLALFR